MTKRLISFLIALCLLIAIPLSARYKYNPFTRKLDYYEPVSGSDLGDLGDVTLTGLATGNVLYYNGTAWVNLATGANTNVLTLAGGVPTWAAPGAPAAHAASHEVGGADLVDHDQLTNYLAAQHLTLPNTLVAVLTDHNLVAHTALGLFDASADVDHDATTNWVANKHIDWTNATQNLSTQGSATLNDNGSTGEIGLNLYSINNTFSTIAQSDAEGIGNSSDLRIGLDETLRALYIMDRGDIGTDFTSTAYVHPSLVFVDETAAYYGYIAMESDLWAFINITAQSFWFETPSYFDFIVDGAGGDLTTGIVFRIGTLEDGTGEFVKNTGTQVFFEINPWVNQTGTAAYQALKANVTETSTGSGTNELLTLQVGSTDVFTIGNKGSLDLTMSHLASRVVIAQSDTTGTDAQPLIFIDDDRTGTYADAKEEATIRIDAEGVYAMYIEDGEVYFTDAAQFASGTSINEFSIDGTLGGNSDDAVPTEKAVKTYVDTNYQPLDNALTDISGLTYVSPSFIKLVANDDYSVRTLAETASDLEADIETVIDTLANLVSIQSQTVTFSGSLNVEANSNINQDVTSDGSPTFGGLTVTNLLSFPATRNIVMGDATPASFGTAIANIFLGLDAGTSTTEGDYNISIGEEAGNFNQTGIGSVKIGYQAGKGGSAKSDGYNVIIGHKTAGFGALEGNGFNVVIGNEAGFQLTTGSQNFLLGYQAGYDLTTQAYNAFLGGVSGKDCIGTGNTGIGYGSMAGGIGAWAGNYNVAIGYNAMAHIAAASGNIGIGYMAGYYMETGGNNVIVGYQAGKGVDGEPFDYNILIGTDVGILITTASSNVMIGYLSGDAVTSGGDHVLIGEKTGGSLTTETGNVMIGHDVGENATVSNELWIDNSNDGTPLIHGDFSADNITINGDFEVVGYHRSDYTLWTDCFDHGSTAAKYGQDWDLTALNTQGNGSNTIQTNPGNITLTTDNNAIGDNEGTRTDYQMVDRASLARTDFGIKLAQTANTQFYCGWNTSGTNAMVAAADEYVIVFFDVANNANWQIKVGDGTTEDVFTSGVAGAVGYVRHEIWVEADGTVHWLVNGTELDITGSVDNLMTASDHYLIVGQAQSVTGAAVIVAEMGYVEHEKLKNH